MRAERRFGSTPAPPPQTVLYENAPASEQLEAESAAPATDAPAARHGDEKREPW